MATRAQRLANPFIEMAQPVISGVLLDERAQSKTIQRAFADATASGDTTVVPAQGAGVRIRVLGLLAGSNLGVNVFFKSGSTKLSATVPLVANTPREWPYVPHGWFETNPNEAFVVNQSLAASTSVEVIWIRVTS